MRDFIRSDILKAIHALKIDAKEISCESADAIREELYQKFAKDKRFEIHWRNFSDRASVQHPDSWEWIGEFVGNGPVYLFCNFDEQPAMFRVSNGQDVVPILGECNLFEFYVTNEALEYILCQNFHDYLIGVGAAKAWVESLQPRHDEWSESLAKERYHDVFVTRASCLPISIRPNDTDTGSRVGGRPPAVLANPPICPHTGRAMLYVLTLEMDHVQPAISRDMALSIFCSPDAAICSAARRPQDPPSIVAVWHRRSPRAQVDEDETRCVYPGRALTIHWGCEDAAQNDPSNPRRGSKVGGNPCAFCSPAQLDALASSNYVFFAQWVDSDYPRSVDCPGFLFGVPGTIFVFARRAEGGELDLESTQCFWEEDV